MRGEVQAEEKEDEYEGIECGSSPGLLLSTASNPAILKAWAPSSLEDIPLMTLSDHRPTAYNG